MKYVIAVLSFIVTVKASAQNTFPTSGNVGIGETSPGLNLGFKDVNATTDMVGITWYNPVPDQYGLYRTAGAWNPPDYQQIKMSWSTGIVLDPGSIYGKSYVDVIGAGIRVTQGSVGIGTTDTRGYKLAINGGMIATAIKVKPYGAWPDYVFEPQYPLLPIDSLGQYLRTHKHLPGIPDARQVYEQDIDVANMTGKLLEKIEELTLYVVEQNQKIRDLQQQLDALKK